MWKSNIQVVLLEKYDILILKIWNDNVARIFSFYLLQMKEEICKKSPVSRSSWNVLIYWKNWKQCWLLCYTSLSWNHTCKVPIFSTSQAIACLHSAAWTSPCLKDTYRKRSRLPFFCAKVESTHKKEKNCHEQNRKAFSGISNAYVTFFEGLISSSHLSYLNSLFLQYFSICAHKSRISQEASAETITRSPFSLMTRAFGSPSLTLPVLYSELSHARRWKGLCKKLWAGSVTCITLRTS